MSTAYERVLDRLREHNWKPKESRPGQATALCPVHEADGQGHKPSLSVTANGDKVLIHCQAGCDSGEILAVLDLTWGDLKPDGGQSSTRRLIAEYAYTDESGNVLYVKQRYDPKDFRQYIPQPDGSKSWSLNGVRRVLFHLPKLADATEVYLSEGEKDVLALEEAGVVATTWADGAWQPKAKPKWKADYSRQLTGKHVTIVQDRDDAGRQTAKDIASELKAYAASVRIVEAAKGNDAYDHIKLAGLTVADFVPVEEQAKRRLILTPATAIRPRRVRWLWDGRLAVGTLALLAGREGQGKSILAYWLAAMITRGTLPGEFFGTPKSVLIAATEDSWSQTIVPRLIAADADITRVYQVEIIAEAVHDNLSLPKDIPSVKKAVRQTDAALLILDPLISRLDGNLDSHKDAEVRLALEPTVRLADDVNLCVLGLIHHNKSGSTDPLQVVMASKAFPAVARSVHTVVPDPDDETNSRKLFGTPKNNLGRADLPTLGFTIDSYPVETEDDIAWTGRLVWGADSTATIFDAMRRSAETSEQKSAAAEASEWLFDYLAKKGGSAESAPIKKAARAAGHSDWAVRRAREQLGLLVEHVSGVAGHVTLWTLPESVSKDREGDRENP
jgi:AAA domain/Toprim domain